MKNALSKLKAKKNLVVMNINEKLAAFGRDEEGATMIEYGLIAALIAVVLVATLTTLGTSLDTKFQEVVSAL